MVKMKRNYKSIFLQGFIFIVLGLFVSNVVSAKTIYVDSSFTGTSQNGESWNTPYNNLQMAIKISQKGDSIWVAKGNYYPTNSTDRNISFTLKKGVALYGGFTGNETSLIQRDIKKNVTVLSGNIGDKTTNVDNSYHVVVGADNARLDGFTIKDGCAVPQVIEQNYKARLHVDPEIILSGPKNVVGGGILNFKATTAVYN